MMKRECEIAIGWGLLGFWTALGMDEENLGWIFETF
jgi:hypothetical protein